MIKSCGQSELCVIPCQVVSTTDRFTSARWSLPYSVPVAERDTSDACERSRRRRIGRCRRSARPGCRVKRAAGGATVCCTSKRRPPAAEPDRAPGPASSAPGRDPVWRAGPRGPAESETNLAVSPEGRIHRRLRRRRGRRAPPPPYSDPGSCAGGLATVRIAGREGWTRASLSLSLSLSFSLSPTPTPTPTQTPTAARRAAR